MSRSSLGGRCLRAIAALAVVSTFVSGPMASAASADPRLALAAQQAAPESSPDQKAAAARQLKIQLTPDMARMTDIDFVIFLWDTADVLDDAKVKQTASEAFRAQSRDNTSCYRFITEGIFPAHQADLVERLNRAQRAEERTRAAEVVSWNNVTQADLRVDLKEFVFRIWERTTDAKDPEVRTAAAGVLTPISTDEQRQAFIVTGIFAARQRDRDRRTEQALREKEEADRKKLDADKRAAAWGLVTRGGAISNDKLAITHREFTYELISRAVAGSKVKADAQTAMDTCDDTTQQVCKDFIYTGVHRAHQLDLEERDRQAAIQTEKDIKAILDVAERDGYLPFLVMAAKTALASDLTERNKFLNTGQYEARKRDRIKPDHRRVIELQGIASGRCLQTFGAGTQRNELTELWDCVRGPKEVWELYQVVEGQYLIQNLNSKQCLTISGEYVVQDNCDNGQPHMLWKFIENATDGSFQLQNVGSGRFAGVKDGGTGNAALIVQYSNTNDGHQRWRVIDPSHRAGLASVNAGVAMVKGVESERCMQTAGLWDTPNEGALADLAAQELWDCVGGGKMSWDIIPLGNNKYALKNLMSSKCLDVKWGQFVNGTQLVQFECHYGGTQQFVFTDAGGSYGLQSVLTAQYADAVGHATQNGALVQQWDHTGLANQRWTLHY
ncbi:RICIN domain-containing protein [Lentzea sp. NPDC005914]|uniref:RICIN domain-containing protein n=1 Tax=Lentzea sp. NPDC005914 TaxID=3154572 RepID=UPI0033D298B5